MSASASSSASEVTTRVASVVCSARTAVLPNLWVALPLMSGVQSSEGSTPCRAALGEDTYYPTGPTPCRPAPRSGPGSRPPPPVHPRGSERLPRSARQSCAERRQLGGQRADPLARVARRRLGTGRPAGGVLRALDGPGRVGEGLEAGLLGGRRPAGRAVRQGPRVLLRAPGRIPFPLGVAGLLPRGGRGGPCLVPGGDGLVALLRPGLHGLGEGALGDAPLRACLDEGVVLAGGLLAGAALGPARGCGVGLGRAAVQGRVRGPGQGGGAFRSGPVAPGLRLPAGGLGRLARLIGEAGAVR